MRRARSLLSLLLVVAAVVAVAHGVESLARFGFTGDRGARVYYDAYHGARHLWDRDNRRHRFGYHTVSGYARFIRALGEAGYEVDVHDRAGIERSELDDYDVLVVGEQTYEGRFMTDGERDALLDWVKGGGSLFTIVGHSNAYYMGDVFNRLFADLPVKVRFDTIADAKQTRPYSVDWVNLQGNPDDLHPVAEGVHEYLMYAGASLDTPYGVMFSPQTSWSDAWEPSNKPVHDPNKAKDPGEPTGPLAGVAAFDYGEGKVVVVGDHSALSNPNIHFGDHLRFAHNAFDWLVADRPNPDLYWIAVGGALVLLVFGQRRRLGVHGAAHGLSVALGLVIFFWWGPGRPARAYDLFVHAGNGASMNYMTKNGRGYLTLYGLWTKEPQLRPWASQNRLEPGHDVLILSSPTVPYDEAQLEIIDGYLRRGKTVIYLASTRSLRSGAGKQLAKRFNYRLRINRAWPAPKKGRDHYLPRGPEDLLESIPRFDVRGGTLPVTVEGGLDPVVHLTRGGDHVSDEGWIRRICAFDLMSEKRVGLMGRFVVIAPIDLFNTGALGDIYKVHGLVSDQMAEFMIRVVKDAAGDDTVLTDE